MSELIDKEKLLKNIDSSIELDKIGGADLDPAYILGVLKTQVERGDFDTQAWDALRIEHHLDKLLGEWQEFVEHGDNGDYFDREEFIHTLIHNLRTSVTKNQDKT